VVIRRRRRELTVETESASGRAACGLFLLIPVRLYYFGTAYFPLILSIPFWVALAGETASRQPRPGRIGAGRFS
jgi:hypothetical protein